jgi:hypothetical protein
VGKSDVDGGASAVTELDGAGRRDDGDVDTGRAVPQRPRPGIIDRLRLMLRATVADQMVLHGRARVVMVGICVVVVLSVGWWAVRPEPPPPEASMPFITDTSPAPPADVRADIVVHVAGAVQRAGVVILTEGARVVDAVQAVGGLTADADLSRVNLALTLTDGAAVIVPIVGEPTAHRHLQRCERAGASQHCRCCAAGNTARGRPGDGVGDYHRARHRGPLHRRR